MSDDSVYRGWIFLSTLTIVFIVLKIIRVMTCSWLWIFSPIWIPIVLAMVLGLVLKAIDIFGNRVQRWLFKIWTGEKDDE